MHCGTKIVCPESGQWIFWLLCSESNYYVFDHATRTEERWKIQKQLSKKRIICTDKFDVISS